MLIKTIQDDLKKAQLDRDEVRVSTLRLLISEINNARIALRQSLKQADLTDQDIVSVVQREVKKRREAAIGFRSGGRENSAQKEEDEAAVLEGYLLEQLSNEELTKIVEESITELGVNSLADMGRVMGAVMGKVVGRADGVAVSKLVKEKLSL